MVAELSAVKQFARFVLLRLRMRGRHCIQHFFQTLMIYDGYGDRVDIHGSLWML